MLLQAGDAVARLRGQLARMVEVGHDVEGPVDGADVADQLVQLRIVEDAERIEGRHLAPDADRADVRDGGQPLDDRPQLRRAHDERISAGQEHVGDLAVRTDVGEAPARVRAPSRRGRS